jgi:hypothetical protein
MSVKVHIPKHLTRHFNNRSEIDIEAADLKTALEIVSRDCHLEDILLTPEGHLQPFIRVVVDDQVVASKTTGGLNDVVVAGKSIRILSAFAGG